MSMNIVQQAASETGAVLKVVWPQEASIRVSRTVPRAEPGTAADGDMVPGSLEGPQEGQALTAVVEDQDV
jgi:hypothetical protein